MACFWHNHTKHTEDCGTLEGMGYLLGGRVDGSVYINTIDSLDLTTETQAVLSTVLSSSRGSGTAVEASVEQRGYLLGGGIAYGTKDVDGFEFATEALRPILWGMSRWWSNGGQAASSTKGYSGPGYFDFAYSSECEGILYTTESFYSAIANLSQARAAPTSFQSSDIGFQYGGFKTAPVTRVIDGIRFSDDTLHVSAQLVYPDSQGFGGGGVETANEGYCMGGRQIYLPLPGTSIYDEIDKFTFAPEATSLVALSLSAHRESPGSFQSSIKGYACAGSASVLPYTDTIEAMVFATETDASVSATLSTTQFQGSNSGIQRSA